jgi:hypothetical protein
MKRTFGRKLTVSATIFSLAMVVSAFGQPNPSPSDSMNPADHSIRQAASDTGNAVVEVYNGAATELRDTKITAQVKSALHGDSATEHSYIHIHTATGVVTLTGQVPSNAVATRAKQLTQSIAGVREVDNDLSISGKSAVAQHTDLMLEIVFSVLRQPQSTSN